MASPQVTHPYPASSSIPIRSHPINSLSRNAPRTRSMSRLNLASMANNKISHLSKTSSSRAGLGKRLEGERKPLRDVHMLPNEQGKRKSEKAGLEERVTKHRKIEDGSIILRPPTPPRPHIPLSTHNHVQPPSTPHRSSTSNAFQTPKRKSPGFMSPAPTPARELLRMKIDDEDEDESTSPTNSPPVNLVIRPPTPPRKHIHTAAIPTTPLRAMEFTIPASIPRIDFSTPNRSTGKPGQSPIKMRLFMPTPISKPFQSPGIALSRPDVPIVTMTVTPSRNLLSSAFTPTLSIPVTPVSLASLIPRPSPKPVEGKPEARTLADTPDEQMDVEDEIETASTKVPASSTSTRPLNAMGPPTRIPAPMSSRPSHTLRSSTSATSSSTLKRSAPSTSSLPIARRPSSKPTNSLMAYGFTSSSDKDSSNVDSIEHPQPTVKRKPSYPSSLGSGPLARPVSRMVSNPIVTSRATSNPISSTSSSMDLDPPQSTSPRSVSDPVPRTNSLSLSMSSRRRDGFSLETSKSLMGLTDALEKLKVKRPENSADIARPRTSISTSMTVTVAERQSGDSSFSLSASTSTKPRMSSSKSRQSLSFQDNSFSTDGQNAEAGNTKERERSIAALMCSTSGGFLKGVVAFVDVYTAEGEDAGPLFTEMLRSCGAKVITRLTESITHVIYKSGRPTTLQWYRKQEDPKPHIVGIGWVTGSKKANKRLLEEGYVVDLGEEDIFQKRRKSMEPKQLALRASVGPGSDLSISKSSLLTVPETSASKSLLQARQRSLLYAPKIGSPLKKAYVSRQSDSDDD